MQPVREVEEAVVHRERRRSVIRPGTGNGQPSSSTLSTAITWSASQPPLSRRKRHIVLESAAPTKPSSASGSWSQRTSSGIRPVSPSSTVCSSALLGQVPEVESAAVAAGGDVVEVEARLVRVRLAELRGDQHVLARLVPEVVVERRRLAAVLPAALDLERLRVEHREAAGAVAVGVAEHADRRRCRRACSARCAAACNPVFATSSSGSITFSIRGAARVVGDVDDVDARRAEARHDQVRAVGAVARGAAAVPAEVVQLVADVRHRRLVDDPPAPRRRRRRGSPARRHRCPRAGRRGRETPRGAPAAPPAARRRSSSSCSFSWLMSVLPVGRSDLLDQIEHVLARVLADHLRVVAANVRVQVVEDSVVRAPRGRRSRTRS